MKWIFRICFFYSLLNTPVLAQDNIGLFRYPDVSKSQIVFAFANKLFIVSKKGGTARLLHSGPGTDSWPKFSPDSKSIAFTSNFNGNYDICTMPANGGERKRLTSDGGYDRMIDWTPNGDSLLFASSRESEVTRYNQFYKISIHGGASARQPLAFGEFASFSPDGRQLALTFESQVGKNWKRYRGGNMAQIHLFNLDNFQAFNISAGYNSADEMPMWSGNTIYFISDRGPEQRMNLWKYNLTSKAFTQLSSYKDFDIHYPSLGTEEIVYEYAGNLYLFNLQTEKTTPVAIRINTAEYPDITKTINTEKYQQYRSLNPNGDTLMIEARGDIYQVAADGATKNITNSSGAAERYPVVSPDGKQLAFFSDQSGEYQLWLKDQITGTSKKVTEYKSGFRYQPYWSPDSRMLVFIDNNQQINLYNLQTGLTKKIDGALNFTHALLEKFSLSWSPDSRLLAYHHDLPNGYNAAFVYEVEAGQSHQITNSFTSCSFPVFSADGKSIYILLSQPQQPIYSDFDNHFVYVNTTKLAVIPLQENNNARIDFNELSSRIQFLPLAGGNYSELKVTDTKLFYLKSANTGSNENKSTLSCFDLTKKEEQQLLENVTQFDINTANDNILANQAGKLILMSANAGNKKIIDLSSMRASINLKEEWKQIFMDAWRMERDYFYDSNMHGLDWLEIRNRYMDWMNKANTREDVIFIIGEMIGELNSSHTFHNGGDIENPPFEGVGYLGVNWKKNGNYYAIKEILTGTPWDLNTKSPLLNTAIQPGDYILSVDGIPLSTNNEPYLPFSAKANKKVQILYNNKPSIDGAKTAVVETIGDESRLRLLSWAEKNRRMVDSLSHGDVGYIFFPNTYTDGQNELVNQLNAQWNKKALIIDNRFNSGGEIPDQLMGLLHQPLYNYWALRNGNATQSPSFTHHGPQAMLINGWTSSGGDAMAVYFKNENLGPLVGSRTKGGVTGAFTTPLLIDGASISVPAFRMYLPNGKWFAEGYGVEPDIAVAEDLQQLAVGNDLQLAAALEQVMKQLEKQADKQPTIPAYEKR